MHGGSRLSAATLGLLVVAGFCSCGIDTIAYLDNKTDAQQPGASSIILKGPESDDETYDGLSIFYKIYAEESTASSDLSYLVAKQNAENAVPGAAVETYLMAAGGLNYHKLVLDDDIPIPTIKKALLTLDYYTTIDFPAGSNIEPSLAIIVNATGVVEKSYTIRRNLSGGGEYPSFLERPQPGDADYQSSTNAEDDKDMYYVQFFAATYGLDLMDFSDVYGDAVFLHRITLNF